ncbi:MAG: hypothetical protein ACAH12_00565 [Methylophilaceae bacterium]
MNNTVQAATVCEIKGEAIFWAYDACLWRYETDDSLHPEVMACADRAQHLIKTKGTCRAKRIFKERICLLIQQTEDNYSTLQTCMDDASVVGPTVKDGGL